MPDERQWDSQRIAELRQVARATSAVSGSRGDDAAFGDAVTPDVMLSLLDELERVRRELHEANTELTTAYMAGFEKARGA